jgi:hypothetical protein
MVNLFSHPIALFFHLFFRTLALLMYFFGSWITDNVILHFVLCILLLSFDFWTVKNVSGRLLVGLRWWNEISKEGTSKWVFESREVSLNSVVSLWITRSRKWVAYFQWELNVFTTYPFCEHMFL